MKGIIDWTVLLCFGLAGFLILADYIAYQKYYPTQNNVLCCATAFYLQVNLLGLLSMLTMS